MDLVVGGMSNNAAAEALGISVRTVENHRARLMDKKQCSNHQGCRGNAANRSFPQWHCENMSDVERANSGRNQGHHPTPSFHRPPFTH